jgi:sorbitol-specific phosphotransferase system component IIA
MTVSQLKDQVLITFDPTVPEAELQSQTQLRADLNRENQFYNTALSGKNPDWRF